MHISLITFTVLTVLFASDAVAIPLNHRVSARNVDESGASGGEAMEPGGGTMGEGMNTPGAGPQSGSQAFCCPPKFGGSLTDIGMQAAKAAGPQVVSAGLSKLGINLRRRFTIGGAVPPVMYQAGECQPMVGQCAMTLTSMTCTTIATGMECTPAAAAGMAGAAAGGPPGSGTPGLPGAGGAPAPVVGGEGGPNSAGPPGGASGGGMSEGLNQGAEGGGSSSHGEGGAAGAGGEEGGF